MIFATLKIKVSQEKHQDAIDTIRAILGWTCAQPGCISMAFFQDTNDLDFMVLIEEWKDWPDKDGNGYDQIPTGTVSDSVDDGP